MTRIPDCGKLIAELIALPSVSSVEPSRDMSNRPVAERLAGWLTDLGFSCEIMPLVDNPAKCNLIATLGSGPGGLILAGHLDTVPFDDHGWSSDPFVLTERDDRLHGLGTADMKSFLALCV